MQKSTGADNLIGVADDELYADVRAARAAKAAATQQLAEADAALQLVMMRRTAGRCRPDETVAGSIRERLADVEARLDRVRSAAA